MRLMPTSLRAAALVLAAFATLAQAQAQAQTSAWPAKSVRMVVPYPPGGSTDVVARLVGQSLSQAWKQPVVIDNRGGASGMIGVEQVARAEPDGYTLLMSASGPQAVNISLFPKVPYDPVKDFAPVALVAMLPLLMVAPANAPYGDVKQFIDWAQKNRAQANFCSIGLGSPSHLAGELFAASSNTRLTHIPYKGSGPALIDVISGTCHVMFDSALSAGPHVRSGKLKLLAVSTENRMPSFPQAPTVAESGLPGFSAYTWTALFAPAGTPQAVVEKMNADTNRILASAEFRTQLENQGASPGKGTPADLARLLHDEIAKWGQLIRTREIKPE